MAKLPVMVTVSGLKGMNGTVRKLNKKLNNLKVKMGALAAALRKLERVARQEAAVRRGR